MTEHTAGPWATGGVGEEIYSDDDNGGTGERIATMWPGRGNQNDVDAARIVACVNALEGVNDVGLFMQKIARLTDVVEFLESVIDAGSSGNAMDVLMNAPAVLDAYYGELLTIEDV